uniref:Transcription factor atf1 n=1 Tax=Lygus hesperus TaxID=30085 RepID=A0A146L8N8_LYGHE
MKEYGMELSLNKTSNLPSNETPTPTRFINNCEAIGLFQDLNPFEETFKKAVENAKRGTLRPQTISVLGKAAGDDLHTPQVFLDGPESHSLESENSGLPEVVIRSEADTSITSQNTPPASLVPVNHGNVSEESVHVLFEMPNGTVLQLSAKPVKNDGPQVREAIRIAPAKAVTSGAVILTTPNANSTVASPPRPSNNPLVKEKLKAFLDGSIKARQEKVKPSPRQTHVPIPQKRPVPIVEEKRPVPLISDPVNETDEERKRKIQERNRRAAFRCREKRKRHMESLLNDNRLLSQEVVSLRAEVVRLQTLLMCHSNCSLTSLDQPVSVPCTSADPVRSPVTSTNEVSDNSTASLLTARSIQVKKDSLTLDIAKAIENTSMDLDSPSIVRRDEVLSSVAPPSTPDERIDPFSDSVYKTEPMDKQMNLATTVIQLNPNVLKTNGSSSA